MRSRLISGYAVLTDRESGRTVKEVDTFNCGHCGRVSHPEVGENPGDNFGHCTICDRHLCRRCATKMDAGGGCDVYEEKLAREEASYEARRSYGLIE